MDSTKETPSTGTPNPTTEENPVKGWNWGAFFLNWIWGLGNRSPLALLCLIPVFNLVWIFVTAVKADKWAWQNGKWESAAQFRRVQKTWGWVGFGFTAALPLLILPLLFIQPDTRSTLPPVKMAIAQLNESQRAVTILGKPIKRNGPIIQEVYNDNATRLNFKIIAPNGSARVDVIATKRDGQWVIHDIKLKNITKTINILSAAEKEKQRE